MMSVPSDSPSDTKSDPFKRGHSIKHFTKNLFGDGSRSISLPIGPVKSIKRRVRGSDGTRSFSIPKFRHSHHDSFNSISSSSTSGVSDTDDNDEEGEEEKDCALPINSTKPDSIVNMLTHASIYCGMNGKLEHSGSKSNLHDDEDYDSSSYISKLVGSSDLNETDVNPVRSQESKGNQETGLEQLIDNLSMNKSLDDVFKKQATPTEKFGGNAEARESSDSLPSISSFQTLQEDEQHTIKPISKPPTIFELSVMENLEPSSITKSISLETSKSQAEKQRILLKVSHKLKKVFRLNDDDIFVQNYSCWLIKDVLLQGHLYLTKENILFFAFLPKTYLVSTRNESTEKNCEEVTIQAGSVGFKTKPIPLSSSITRYWAVLKFNNLSFFSDSVSLYFPNLVIDMKKCLRAELMDDEDDEGWFKLITVDRTYKFHTDNLYVARQWVFNLTKLIFQHTNSNSRNEVLIKIPISNIIDVEDTKLLNSQNAGEKSKHEEKLHSDEDSGDNPGEPSSFRIRYLENDVHESHNRDDESFGVDEIYFMFFLDAHSFHNKISQLIQHSNKSPVSSSDLNSTTAAPTSDVSNHAQSLKASGHTYSTIKSPKPPKSPDTRTGRPASNSITSSISKIRSNLKPFSKKDSDSSNTDRKQALSPNALSPHPLSKIKSSDLEELDLSVNHVNYFNEKLMNYKGDDESKKSIESLTSNLSEENDDFAGEVEERKDVTKAQLPLIANSSHTRTSFEESEQSSSSPSSRWKPKILMKGVATTGKAIYNVTNMWSSEPSHYDEVNSIERGAEDPYFIQSSDDRIQATHNFQKYFSLGEDKKLLASYYTYLQKNVPIYGKIYLGESEVCFRSLLPGVNTKMILPLTDIENCYKEKGFRFTYSGLVIVIHGHEELFFEFSSSAARDDCELFLLKQSENFRSKSKHLKLGPAVKVDTEVNLASSRVDKARIKLVEDRINAAVGLDVPIIAEDNKYFKTSIKPKKSFKFTLLTIGSRGDVQPYISLGNGLMQEGHEVTIATHAEFKDWVESYGIGFAEIAGNPAELMSLMVTHGTMSVSFLKEASSKFRGWITELLQTSWDACQGTDILIESPSAMGGVHIAEALCIPYFRAFTMPWTRTRAYPHAFIVPDQKRGGSYNYLTHVMFENIFWKGISGQVNKWRVEILNLPKTNLDRLQQTKIPFMYNVSPTIFPPSVDFSDWVKVTGYWFLDEGLDYKPPQELIDFMERARTDKKKLVYIGFGSIVVSDSKSLTEAIVEAVAIADVRCILNKGWSDRLNAKDKHVPEIELPKEMYNSGSIPHDWLFPKIDAAVHHGGSGTTGATMRAGLPTIIKPFFGDQFFYANRVEDIGAGVALKKLNAKSLSKALKKVTTDSRIIEKAKNIGEKIRDENGVLNAIEVIYNELEYARTLIVNKQQANKLVTDNNEEVPSDEEDSTSDSSWLII